MRISITAPDNKKNQIHQRLQRQTQHQQKKTK